MLQKIKKLQDVDVNGKTVVVRANLDVPLDESGEIKDTTKVKALIPTLQYLIEQNCKIVLISHLGNPQGQYDDSLSLMPVRFELGRELNKSIKFVSITECENSIKFLEAGDILLFENVRFCEGEQSPEASKRKDFIEKVASLCHVYVNESFGFYGKDATLYDLPKMMEVKVAGLHLQKEITELTKLLKDINHPYIGIIGGANVSEKIPTLKSLVQKTDKILLGSVIAYTFMKAMGIEVGKSQIALDSLKDAKEVLELAKQHNCEIIYPIDHICAKEVDETATPVEVGTQMISKDLTALDIGPKTLMFYREVLESAKTVFWTGPMGKYEWENFNRGTEAIGEYIALTTPKDAIKIAGGDETIISINMLKVKPKRFNHVSIGGEMMLKFLAGEKFEVLEILK